MNSGRFIALKTKNCPIGAVFLLHKKDCPPGSPLWSKTETEGWFSWVKIREFFAKNEILKQIKSIFFVSYPIIL
jgi:hypothetical protein